MPRLLAGPFSAEEGVRRLAQRLGIDTGVETADISQYRPAVDD